MSVFGIPRIDPLLKNLQGKNILILGPPGQEKLLLGLKFIHEGLRTSESATIITTDLSPEEIEEKGEEMSTNLRSYTGKTLYFVDCYSWAIGSERTNDRHDILVAGPSALNDLSIGITQAVQQLYRPNTSLRILFHSVSTLLLYNQPEVVFRFIQITGARLKSLKATSVFLMDEGMHDEKTITTVKHLVDFVIEIKQEDDRFKVSFPSNGQFIKMEIKTTPVGITLV